MWRALLFYTFLFLLPLPPGVAGEPSDAEFPLTVTLAGVAEIPVAEGRLIAEAADGSDDRREIEARAPGRVELRLPAGSWILRFEAEDLWSPTLGVLVQQAQRERLDIHRLVPVTGSLQVATGDRPDLLEARLLESESESAPVRIGLEIDESGRLTGALPEGTWDLRLHSPGFMPSYRWSQELEPSKPLDLGRLDLRRGSSVSGLVTIEAKAGSRAPSLRDVTVRLVPATGHSTWAESQKAQRQRQSRSLDSAVDVRGLYQFAGVEPGTYEVTAELEGYVANRLGPITILDERSAAWLEDPLSLAPPLQVDFEIEPSSDPYGQPWELTLRNREVDRTVASGTGGTAGTWSVRDLKPGEYQLWVESLDERERTEPWHLEDFTLEVDSSTIRVDIPILRVRGSLTYRDEPVAETSLRLSQDSGSAAIVLHSDQDGEFEGYLPKGGRWKPEIWIPSSRSNLALESVEIEPMAGTNEAFLDLTIPGETIEGQVLWPDGRIAIDAVVEASAIDRAPEPDGTGSSTRTSWTRTDEEGRFSLLGLRDGEVTVSARAASADGRGSSTPVVVQILEESSPPYQRLVLVPYRAITGRVTFQGHPQPGATVVAMLQRYSGIIETLPSPEVTGGNGRFVLELPSDRPFALWASVPGIGATVTWLPSSDNESISIDIALPGNPGNILLPESFATPLPNGVRTGEFALLSESGIIEVTTLFRWQAENRSSRSGGGAWLIPLMDPGTYRLCPGTILNGTLEGSPDEVCTSGFLPPGGTLDLTSP